MSAALGTITICALTVKICKSMEVDCPTVGMGGRLVLGAAFCCMLSWLQAVVEAI